MMKLALILHFDQFGVCHADDLYYLFDPVFGLPPNLLSGEVLKMFLNFCPELRF